MIAVEHELALRVSPERVWKALTDFGGYAAWHPSLRLGGNPELGATIDFNLVNARRGWESGAADAVISKLQPVEILEWRAGIPYLFNFAESYALSPSPGGTRLVHRVEYRGLAVPFASKRAVASWHTRIRTADIALHRYLESTNERITRAAPRRAGSKRLKR